VYLYLGLIKSNGVSKLPTFITNKGRDVVVTPKDNSQIGIYKINVTITDKNLSTVNVFYVTVLK
jgi:hypothetical protein